ncbi:CBM96 family carbohydrate-binding protein [Formosa haliotis]|uniref:CBM96 family carbohydrate-binding protein n=1 Tax=Formosa haliotis TaxID=1555194 RepID=UPI000826B5C5|nr:DNRLRE domain-containing protein [Formosa haliotis]
MKNYIFLMLMAMCVEFSAQNIQRLSPTDDTYADGGKSTEILGNTQSQQMWVKTGSSAAFTRMGFIKFDISGLSLADVGTAKLRLYCYDTQSTDMMISAFNIDETWSESTLTWDNQPVMISPSVRSQKVEENAYVEWQITRLVQDAVTLGKTSISLGLSDENGDNKLARFYTKESTDPNKPQLYISDEIEDYQALGTIEDAMVVGGSNANTNYGTDTGIQVKAGSSNNSFVKKGLLKFDLNQIDVNKVSTVGTARLRLYFTSSNNSTPDLDLSILPVENTWDEETVTWNSYPAFIDTNPLRTTEVLPGELNKYYEWDISAYVIAKLAEAGDGGVLSLTVLDLAGDNNGLTFYSKEAANFHPMLELLEEPTNVSPPSTAITGIHYLDFLNGDDANNGNSPATAWKTLSKLNASTFGAGARILFKTGQSWTGTLKLKGSGEAGNPIVVASYGKGAKPIIHGAGASETIHLDGNEYVEIRNLEITNYNPAEEGGISMEAWEAKNITDWFDNPTAGYDLTPNTNKVGVRVNAQDLGEVNHIHLVNLDIHGINGDNEDKNNGGIYMEITGSIVPTYYNDFLVEGCHIYDVDRTGMSNVSTWDDRTLTNNGNWTPTLNFIVRNNVFERSGANALILRNAKDPIIEYNLFHQCAVKGSGNAAFNFNTDGCVFQYNEARFTKGNIGDEDAGGLDSDFRTKNTILQYNYVHDNAYGMLATGGGFSTSFNDNTIFRYNVIERDGLVARENGEKFAFKLSGKITNTTFHNNVIYLSAEQTGVDVMFHKQWSGKPANTKYYNNIYYLEGSNHGYDVSASTGNTFSNNLFYKAGTNITVPSGNNSITTDPLFVAVNAGPQGYKLKAGSPAIGSGLEIAGNTSVGYFGNPIPATGAIDRGIHRFSTMNTSNTPGGFSKDEFDVYLLIGQSNMAGRGEIGTLDEAPLTNAYLFNDADGWENAETPLNKYSTVGKDISNQKLNPGYVFARKLTEYTNRGIGLVVNARGGTKIELWEKGYSGADDMDLYEEAVARLLEAKKAGVFKGILWHQGESNQNSSSGYMAKLKQLVMDLRADLGENAFFVAGEINKWRPESEPINTVISSISNDINQASYIKSDDLAPINGDLTDPHFDTFSQRILGGLYADEILKNVYNMSPGVATLYSQCDYEGYAVSLRTGIYNLEELEKRGVIDNDIRSLKLDAGYEVLLFTEQQTGQSELISTSNDCLSGITANDVSFVVVGETGSTSSMLSTNDVIKKFGGVIISPNPAKKKIKIIFSLNASVASISKVQIIDLQGRVINLDTKNSITTHNTIEFDLNHLDLASGLYVVKLVTPDYSFNKKLIIK